jgi:predicted dehydrogenase
MRIAVAGTGSIGRRHIAHLQALLPDLQLVLLRAHGRIDAYAEAQHAEVLPDLAAALHQPLDALVIATPSDLHADLVLQGLAAGLAMYIEKPVVTTAEQLQRAQAQSTSGGTCPLIQIGCNLRFLPSLLRLRQLLQEGVIGQVVRASFDAGQWLPDWRPQQDHRQSYSADPRRGGGVLLDLIHEIDSSRWLLGELSPVACTIGRVPALAIGSEGAATGLLRSTEGALVQLGLDYVARRPIRRYQLVGELGTLIWDLPRQELILEGPAQRRHIACGTHGFDVPATYPAAMAAFVASLRGQAPPVQPLQDGLASAALAIRLKELACPNH